jgi:DNA (cytosine-5)-methyltransferase 1
MKFIDLFAGIGGFHIAFHNLGAECVFASEIDKNARITYKENLYTYSPKLFDSGMYNDDILKIDANSSQIPEFDILCAGFPCQPFSQAGYKRGFSENKDDRGNMFFNICSIIENKRPKAFFLENVRHILKHDDGKTFEVIKNYLEEQLNYSFHYKVVKASEFGLPQHRPRVFMVGFRKDSDSLPEFNFPKPTKLEKSMSDIWGGKCSREIGFTLRVGGRRSGIHDRRNWDTYLVNDEIKVLSSQEGIKMMGFPDDFKFSVSETQAMKQLGNSVAVNAIEATGNEILRYLKVNSDLFLDCSQLEVA